VIKSALGRDSISKEFDPSLSIDEDRAIAAGCLAEGQSPPRVLRVRDSSDIPDIIGWSTGPWIVSPQIRDELARLEDRHEFLDIDILKKNGSPSLRHYFLILTTQSLEAIVYNETEFTDGFGVTGAEASYYTLKDPGKCVLNAKIIAGHHLWRGVGKMFYQYFCSDELGDFILKNKLRGWRLRHCDLT
jgi:hypothetical protein